MTTINLEEGHPDVRTAMVRLNNRLYAVRATGVKWAKIVHGYGSTGTGGAIKAALRTELRSFIGRGVIKDFVMGDEFGPFSQKGRDIVAKYPALRSDRDWARSNDGITVVIFK